MIQADPVDPTDHFGLDGDGNLDGEPGQGDLTGGSMGCHCDTASEAPPTGILAGMLAGLAVLEVRR